MAVFDNLQIKDTSASASGKSIHVVNSASGKFKDLKIFGESTQAATPTPDNPQEIESSVLSEIKTCRKNLLDCSGLKTTTTNGVTFTPKYDDNGLLEYINVNGTNSGSGEATYKIGGNLLSHLMFGTEYILNGCPNGGSANTYRIQHWGYNGAYAVHDYGSSVTYTFNDDDDNGNVAIIVSSGVTVSNLKFYPMISYEGGEYEPYTESVVTLSEPITLNGLNGVSDYVDVKRGVLVQKFKEVVFDGSDDESWGYSKTTWKEQDYNVFRTEVTECNYRNDNTINYACSNFRAITVNQRYENNTLMVNTTKNLMFTANQFTTVGEWKTWLTSNNVTVLYELAEPIETPLNAEDLAALSALETFCPVTNVFNDGNAEMNAEYFKNNNIGKDLADVHAIAAESHVLVAEAQEAAENAQEALASCLYIVSFDAESGVLVTRSADYKG